MFDGSVVVVMVSRRHWCYRYQESELEIQGYSQIFILDTVVRFESIDDYVDNL